MEDIPHISQSYRSKAAIKSGPGWETTKNPKSWDALGTKLRSVGKYLSGAARRKEDGGFASANSAAAHKATVVSGRATAGFGLLEGRPEECCHHPPEHERGGWWGARARSSPRRRFDRGARAAL